MKKLVIVVLLLGFSYFAWTRVSASLILDFKAETNAALKTANEWKAKAEEAVKSVDTEKAKTKALRETFVLAFPDRKEQIDKILGIQPTTQPTAESQPTTQTVTVK